MKALIKAPILALAVLCAGAALAQSPGGTPHQSQMDRLSILLDLTDAQKPKVQAILQSEHTQMKQLWEQVKASGTKPDFQAMHAARQQIAQDAVTKLSGVLSAAQLTKFQTLEKMAHHHGFGRRGGGAGAQTPATGTTQN
jgi:ABC-type phosphate transport system substrate-binding protein